MFWCRITLSGISPSIFILRDICDEGHYSSSLVSRFTALSKSACAPRSTTMSSG